LREAGAVIPLAPEVASGWRRLATPDLVLRDLVSSLMQLGEIGCALLLRVDGCWLARLLVASAAWLLHRQPHVQAGSRTLHLLEALLEKTHRLCGRKSRPPVSCRAGPSSWPACGSDARASLCSSSLRPCGREG